MAAAHALQSHRGPDSSGTASFVVGDATLIFGHQRLSIIDLSDAGRQPMSYGGDRGSIVYNGELYNYLELRAELAAAGEHFGTETDTEVLLTALHHWGTERALGKFNWMGAFAWFDRRNAKLVLARDAGAEKPLYYSCTDDHLFFSSEIKTLLTLAQRKFCLDRDVVGQFIYQGLSDATPQTFFKDVTQLAPGTYVELALPASRYSIRPKSYRPPAYHGNAESMPITDFVAEVRRLFVDSVKLRLRSDVPIGVLLSGGIDSSAIASVTQSLQGPERELHLLSAISEDPRFDESAHIGIMERYLGQVAHKISLKTDPGKLVDDLLTVNWFNDAPVSGLSALGHFRMMQKAKELGLTVILSGQGADEILLGYRKFLGFYLQSLLRSGDVWRAITVLSKFIRNKTIVKQFNVGDAKRYVPFLQSIGKLTRREDAIATEGDWLRDWQRLDVSLGPGSLGDRQMLDIRQFSVPSLCHYEDRMSMSQSREIRLPYLDSRLIDLLVRAPDEYKLRDGWTKYSLRKALGEYLPPEICWRKDKMGFSNPQGEWLKDELKGPVSDAFSSSSLIVQKDIVNSGAMRRKYEHYCSQPADGGSIWYREIFAPFSLELWMQRYAAWIE